MNRNRLIRNLSGIVLIGTLSISASVPIRVGILKGSGPNRYCHSSMHPGAAALATMLANPAQAGLENPLIPAQGFTVTMYGAVDTGSGISACKTSPAHITAFVNALDSLHVVVIPNFVDIGGSISNTTQRARFEAFARTKGWISMHWSLDSYGNWPQWDTLTGTRFRQWQLNGDGTVRLDTTGFSQRPLSWKFLNRGLPDTARFREEWIAFTTTGAMIRSQPFLVPTVNLDENSMASTNNAPMGDHPISWYREFPEGGRFFYTSMGDRTQSYESVYFFRRQLYNAILWAAGADSNGVVPVRPAGRAGAGNPLKTWVSGSRIHVRVAEETPFTVDIHALDGKRIASQRGTQAEALIFADIPPHAVYVITVTTPRARASHRILLD